MEGAERVKRGWIISSHASVSPVHYTIRTGEAKKLDLS